MTQTLLVWDSVVLPTKPENVSWNSPEQKRYDRELDDWHNQWKAYLNEDPLYVRILKAFKGGDITGKKHKIFGGKPSNVTHHAYVQIIVDRQGNMQVSGNGTMVMSPKESRKLSRAVREAVEYMVQWEEHHGRR